MFENISAEAFEKELESNKEAIILDVRTPEEFAAGHLVNAVNLDYNGGQFEMEFEQLDKGKTYLVYCRSGMRSYNACMMMENAGFEKSINMMGGIIAWPGETTK